LAFDDELFLCHLKQTTLEEQFAYNDLLESKLDDEMGGDKGFEDPATNNNNNNKGNTTMAHTPLLAQPKMVCPV